MSRPLLALVIVAAYALFSLWCFRRNRRPATSIQQQVADLLLAFASQTGHAQQLAQQTADTIQASGQQVSVMALNDVTLDILRQYKRALFIVSTTGEGDAPDNATEFVLKAMSNEINPNDMNLSTLQYGLLALGDRRYSYYCGFGHALDAWLRHAHALPMFDMVEVDNGDAGTLRHWQSQLGLLTGIHETADWNPPDYQVWRLLDRRLLNAGSAGGSVYHLKLQAPDSHVGWQAGDIAEIGPRNSDDAILAFLHAMGLSPVLECVQDGEPWPQWLASRLLPDSVEETALLKGLQPTELASTLKLLAHREYSIASLPQDGLELVVRQVRNANATLGHGSGWLTSHAQLGDNIALRVRANSMFHLAAGQTPLILIGNGTGIAGLRAHLKASVQSGGTRHWLIFGERNAACDAYFEDEFDDLQQRGLLTRRDLAYSRDQQSPKYVQDLLASAADELRAWVEMGATILVCGSATGMAPAVHSVLVDTLGVDALAVLLAAGRYKRDIY